MSVNESNFNFLNPRLVEMSYEINSNFKAIGEEVSMPVQLGVDKGIPEDNEADISLSIEIGDKEDICPFLLKITMASRFRWSEGAFDEQTLKRLLSRNAPALLLSYARPLVATVTNASGFPAYNIPYLDLSQLDEE